MKLGDLDIAVDRGPIAGIVGGLVRRTTPPSETSIRLPLASKVISRESAWPALLPAVPPFGISALPVACVRWSHWFDTVPVKPRARVVSPRNMCA